VRFFLTQPIFSDEALEALGKARSALDAKILAGVMPLASYNNALFVSNEVPGMRVPDALVERFRDLGKEEAERLGAETAGKTVKDALPYADGFYVVTPLGRFRVTETLIAQIRRLTDDQNR
jgi:homocysteine S-methyltransferase